ncbi:hypothetical protein BDP27DRAFT_1315960 [Rhodocollybia butyracea]|uniref:Uncharacterized protein n=1 Tax=Rhodocollybia butyracea TaxID=206335 RepID=A0A9P5Q701_9AGAR|nr:hypothetical protein BDP27DRAFT_1315960 [Rhodocollybia butyracea]
MSPFPDCKALVETENVAQTIIGSASNPENLWIFTSALVLMTILLRCTIFPCVTLRGLEDTVISADKVLKEHIGLAVGTRSTDLCYVSGLARGLLDFDEHLVRRDRQRYLDHGDPERSRRCMDFEERLCRIKDVVHDLHLTSSTPVCLRSRWRLSISRLYSISSAYKEIHALRQDIEYSIVVSAKWQNKLKLDVAALIRERSVG